MVKKQIQKHNIGKNEGPVMKIGKWNYLSLTVFAAATCIFANCTVGSNKQISEGKQNTHVQPTGSAGRTVTPVRGPSWIKHLGIQDIRQTSMGQMGGREPAPASRRKEPGLAEEESVAEGSNRMSMGRMMGRIFSNYRSNQNEVTRLMNETFRLSGSDLYRLNCQSCHSPNGTGKQPEINSLVGPVEGTSQTFIENWGKKLGHPIESEMAQQLAADAVSTLRQRLDNGGKRMPAFRHLKGDERDALIAYLQVLAGVSSKGGGRILVTESVARVGEHLVKGTCHICHNATGSGGGHMAMMSGIIPSLASFPVEKTMQDVIRQLEQGSMPMMAMMGGQIMPAYPYITEDEGAAAYLYLEKYPPEK
jgi:mono/diheme cytochrome c family protein